jgi:hypothetical protein
MISAPLALLPLLPYHTRESCTPTHWHVPKNRPTSWALAPYRRLRFLPLCPRSIPRSSDPMKALLNPPAFAPGIPAGRCAGAGPTLRSRGGRCRSSRRRRGWPRGGPPRPGAEPPPTPTARRLSRAPAAGAHKLSTAGTEGGGAPRSGLGAGSRRGGRVWQTPSALRESTCARGQADHLPC